MKYPQLVPDRVCKIPCEVTLYSEEYNEDGEPIVAFTDTLMCNYQDKAVRNFTGEQVLTVITGNALFNGDICPALAEITSGKVKIFNVVRDIACGQKNRNPDGTVNYTRLELR